MKSLLLVAGLLFGCHQNHCNQCERHTGIDDMGQRIERPTMGAPDRPDCYAIEKLYYDPYEPRAEVDSGHPLYAVSGWWGTWDNTEEHLNEVGAYNARWYWWERVFTNINDTENYLRKHIELRPLCGGKISIGEL